MFLEFPKNDKGNKDRKAFYSSEDGLLLIRQWKREGLSNKRIAEEMIGISEALLTEWRRADSKIERALIEGAEYANAMVEQSLYKRAIGYDYKETTEELVEGQMLVTKTVVKHMAPDTKAAMAWLFSRRPDRWRAIQEPTDEIKNEIDNAKKILIAIEDVAKTGQPKEIEMENKNEC